MTHARARPARGELASCTGCEQTVRLERLLPLCDTCGRLVRRTPAAAPARRGLFSWMRPPHRRRRSGQLFLKVAAR